ncbi:hypothetical protein AOQ84DRAFT_354949 [Glonium stellatum]|uniref:Uncharacterized protein n=1 Tax=Glonium stellatum TaxID=574774 RepID=A0A8E2EYW6_9PEZI|nr:hypothetical protein AOQ84DRAFT_354949 [Glonium stellatum]
MNPRIASTRSTLNGCHSSLILFPLKCEMPLPVASYESLSKPPFRFFWLHVSVRLASPSRDTTGIHRGALHTVSPNLWLIISALFNIPPYFILLFASGQAPGGTGS